LIIPLFDGKRGIGGDLKHKQGNRGGFKNTKSNPT